MKDIYSDICISSGSLRPTTKDVQSVCNVGWINSARKQSEWCVRLTREYAYTTCNNGMVVFATLTFDDSHLVYAKHDYEDCYIRCHIDFPHYKLFDNEGFSEDVVRSLRQVDHFEFRYVAFPEYGSDSDYVDDYGNHRKGTVRPHYHVLFFVYNSVDFERFRSRLFAHWGRCAEQAFDCIRITEDNGFSRYVSKYCAKGIAFEHTPLLVDLKKSNNDIIRKYRDTPLSNIKGHERVLLETAVYCNHWLGHHMPKVLCSNGIGCHDGLEYTEKELKDGYVMIFNGTKYVPEYIPSFAVRKFLNNVRKIDLDINWSVREGLIIEDSHKVIYCWELNDIGREVKKKLYDETRCKQYMTWCDILSHSGPITPHERSLFENESELIDLANCERWEDVMSSISKELSEVYGSVAHASDVCHAYAHMWLGMSTLRIADLTGYECERIARDCFDTEGLRCEFDVFYGMARTFFNHLVDLPSDYMLYSPSLPHGLSSVLFDNLFESARVVKRTIAIFRQLNYVFKTLEYEKRHEERKRNRVAKQLLFGFK